MSTVIPVDFSLEQFKRRFRQNWEALDRTDEQLRYVAAYARNHPSIASVAHGSDCSNVPRSSQSSVRPIKEPQDAA